MFTNKIGQPCRLESITIMHVSYKVYDHPCPRALPLDHNPMATMHAQRYKNILVTSTIAI